MSLRVMAFLGFLALILGWILFWFTPATMSQVRSVKPIGTSAVSHGESSSAAQPRSRTDPPDSVGSFEELDTQRR